MEGFLDYKRYRWACVTALVLSVCTVIYLCDHPIGGRNGGTVVGYTFGALATAGILHLMWFGIRKRSYRSHTTTLKGWLSAHVWLGIGLLVLVPLHAGFSLNWNIHSLAYILMCLVIATGIWGAIAYATMAPEIKSHRGGAKSSQLLEQIQSLSTEMRTLAGSGSSALLTLGAELAPTPNLSLRGILFTRAPEPADAATTAKLISTLPEADQAKALSLAALAQRRHKLIAQLVRETRVLTGLRVWLLIHLPLSFALVAAVCAHIFVVFWYW